MSTSTRATSRARSRPSTEDRVMVENIIRPPVQLDLEAKRVLVRERTSPIKVHQSREKKRDRLE
jgi:hypothetical protein